jgi:GST-like protein
MCGGDYTIADIAIWPWYGAVILNAAYGAAEFLSAHEYKNMARWTNQILERPAVTRGRMVNKPSDEPTPLRERHSASDFDKV